MKKWIGLIAAVALSACTEKTEENVQALDQKTKASVFREVSYFSPTAAGRDMEMGTHITTFFSEVYEPTPQGLRYQRSFDSSMGEGMFQRIAFPEIAYRGRLGLLQGKTGLDSIFGVSNFYAEVIDTMRLGSFIKGDFKRSYYLSTLEPELRNWWAVSHLLQGVQPLNRKLDLKALPSYATAKLDSVWVYGLEEDDLGNCLHYTAWYQVPDTLVGGMLYLQSLKTSPKLAEEAKSSKYLGALAKVKHSVWINPKNGLLCKEDVLRDYQIQMQDTLKKTRREFNASSSIATVYRYED